VTCIVARNELPSCSTTLMKAVSFMLSVDWIAMMSVELLIKSNS